MTEFRGHIVDIIGRCIFDGRINVIDGKIQSIQECELSGESLPYILPGFIDSHVHIESSMLTPVAFSKAAVGYGMIGAVTDPHEIANVLGVSGVEFMLENASNSSFNFCFGAPSCVPSCSSDIESSGAVLTSREVKALLQDPRIGYLSEMMNFPGVLARDPEVMAKINAAAQAGKPVDGHAPGLVGEDRARYAAAGISTDHECTRYDEGLSCVRSGMFVLIREGSAARNFEALIPLIKDYPDKVMFCSDDIHPGHSQGGPILSMVRRALAYGYDLWDVLRAASLNPQLHYGLNWGLLRQGDPATFIMVDELSSEMSILGTYIHGEPLKVREMSLGSYPNCFNASPICAADIACSPACRVPVICARDGELFTTCEYADRDDVSYPWSEVQKIVVVNRYDSGAVPSVGFIRGFNIVNGAMAASVAHDCHNIVAIGSCDQNIVIAVNEVVRMKGGIAVVDGNSNIVELELPIAGLMSPLGETEVTRRSGEILSAIASTGCTLLSPLITMSFMCLPVIPQLKLTDKGLFDSDSWSFK